MANFEFKPFDKILVRNCIMGHKAYWIPALYGFKSKDMKHYLTSAGWQEECIPYEGNEEYLGTTKDYVDIISKFKVGDWICHDVYKKPLLIVEDLGEGDFRTEPKSIITAKEFREGFYRLWTIQDAKDGDVLCTPLPKGYEAGVQIFIFKEIKCRDYVDNCIEYYCRVCQGVFYENEIGFMGTTTDGIFHPATKEQRDLLFQKMKEAGYEWDAEKKELRKIEQKSATWSEEDEHLLDYSLQNLAELENRYGKEYGRVGECINWLKSLKDRVQPRSQWKPSDTQMASIKQAVSNMKNSACYDSELVHLLQDLEKLREE